MFCKECGKPIKEDAFYCGNCGVKIDNASHADGVAAPQKEMRKNASTGRKKYKLAALGVVIALLGIIFAVFIYSDFYKCNRIIKLAEKSAEAGEAADIDDYYEEALMLVDTSEDMYLSFSDMYLAVEEYEKAVEVLQEGIANTGEQVLLDRESYLQDNIVIRKEIYDGGEMREYEYDKAGNLIKEQYYYSSGMEGYCTEYEYDRDGNLVKEQYYYSDGTVGDCTEYEYDKDGNLVKEQYYDSDGTVGNCSEYEYDEDGTLVKEQHYYNNEIDSEYEYEYDKDGTLVKECYSNGTVDTCTEYEYDKDGNLVKEQYYINDATDIGCREYEYDRDGNLIKEQRYYSDGTVDTCGEYEYDKDGNLIKEQRYENDYYTEYEYGKIGNLLMEKSISSSDGRPLRQQEYNSLGDLVWAADGYSDWRYIYIYDYIGE